jgi:hypothetical protein
VNSGLETNIDEIADGVFRFSTWIPGITEHGFTFNQFLLTGEQPVLFHCGMRQLFPLVSWAIGKVIGSNGCAGSPSPTSRPTSAVG